MDNVVNTTGQEALVEQSTTITESDTLKNQALRAHQLLDQLLAKQYGAMEISKHQNSINVHVIDKFKF